MAGRLAPHLVDIRRCVKQPNAESWTRSRQHAPGSTVWYGDVIGTVYKVDDMDAPKDKPTG